MLDTKKISPFSPLDPASIFSSFGIGINLLKSNEYPPSVFVSNLSPNSFFANNSICSPIWYIHSSLFYITKKSRILSTQILSLSNL